MLVCIDSCECSNVRFSSSGLSRRQGMGAKNKKGLRGMHMRADVDVGAPESELRRNLRGEVRFSDGDRALYSPDSSNYRQIPIRVVIPRDRSDVIAPVASCRRYGAPITGRGGGTSLAGQCCNVAVIIDFTKYYNRILQLHVEQTLVRLQRCI